jgi:hypothetical protein
LYSRYGKITCWTKNNLLDFYSDLQKVLYFENWTINREKLKNDLLACEGNNTYQTICKVVYSDYISFFKKEEIITFGDKNPVYSLSVRRLFNIFPDSKYIYLTRDYRDHILSMLRTELYTPDILALAYRWRYSAVQMKKLTDKYPDSFHTIRYEDFVGDPYHHLEKMCQFVGIEFKPEVLEFHKREEEAKELFPPGVREKFFKNLFKPIDASRTYLWKSQMNDEDVRKVDAMVGKWAEMLGYERKFIDFDMKTFLKVLPARIYLDVFYSLAFIRRKLPRWMKSKKHAHITRQPDE